MPGGNVRLQGRIRAPGGAGLLHKATPAGLKKTLICVSIVAAFINSAAINGCDSHFESVFLLIRTMYLSWNPGDGAARVVVRLPYYAMHRPGSGGRGPGRLR